MQAGHVTTNAIHTRQPHPLMYKLNSACSSNQPVTCPNPSPAWARLRFGFRDSPAFPQPLACMGRTKPLLLCCVCRSPNPSPVWAGLKVQESLPQLVPQPLACMGRTLELGDPRGADSKPLTYEPDKQVVVVQYPNPLPARAGRCRPTRPSGPGPQPLAHVDRTAGSAECNPSPSLAWAGRITDQFKRDAAPQPPLTCTGP